MDIFLENIGKKYNRSWVFRNLSYQFKSNESYAILGSNGSGKSTLLQIIAGYQTPTKGSLHYSLNEKKIKPEDFFRHISLATPYLELPEELTLAEMLRFHSHFKKPLSSLEDIMERIELGKERDKEIKNFSSGMRQRLRLGLSLLFDSRIILLDEPTTHLDAKAIALYRALVQAYSAGRCLIISSNQEEEYSFCNHRLTVEQYK